MAEVAVITLEVPGKTGQYVDFKAEGWKYKHLRLWEEATGAGETAEIISERIANWRLLDDETGTEIPFIPGKYALDELPRETATWLVGVAYLRAYRQAGTPHPNA